MCALWPIFLFKSLFAFSFRDQTKEGLWCPQSLFVLNERLAEKLSTTTTLGFLAQRALESSVFTQNQKLCLSFATRTLRAGRPEGLISLSVSLWIGLRQTTCSSWASQISGLWEQNKIWCIFPSAEGGNSGISFPKIDTPVCIQRCSVNGQQSNESLNVVCTQWCRTYQAVTSPRHIAYGQWLIVLFNFRKFKWLVESLFSANIRWTKTNM